MRGRTPCFACVRASGLSRVNGLLFAQTEAPGSGARNVCATREEGDRKLFLETRGAPLNTWCLCHQEEKKQSVDSLGRLIVSGTGAGVLKGGEWRNCGLLILACPTTTSNNDWSLS